MRRVVGAAVAAFALLSCGGGDGGSGPTGQQCVNTCLIVDNQSANLTISQVNFSNCGDPSWGEDRLGDATLGPGESYGWEVAPGCWDIRALAFSSGTYTSASFGITLAVGDQYTLTFNFAAGASVAP
jgi:hypothetical protein